MQKKSMWQKFLFPFSFRIVKAEGEPEYEAGDENYDVTEDASLIPEIKSTAAPASVSGDLRNRIRSEERQKLHTQITNAKTANDSLTRQLADKEKQVTDLEAKVASLEARAGQTESEALKEITKEVKRLTAELAVRERDLSTALASQVSREDIESELRKDYELEIHRLRLISTERDDIIPELVQGSTVEELEASVAKSKARLDALRGTPTSAGGKNNTFQAQPARQPAASPRGTSPRSGGKKPISQMGPDDIAAMNNMTDAEWDTFRKTLADEIPLTPALGTPGEF